MFKMEKNYFVVDGIIPKQIQDKIENTINDSYFPWYKNENNLTVTTEAANEYANDNRIKENIMLVHTFHQYDYGKTTKNSNYDWIVTEICKAIINKYAMKEVHILRSKVNLLIKDLNLKDEITTPHIDLEDQAERALTILYYVNNSDGDTHILNKEKQVIDKISPNRGRLLFMKGTTLHSAQWPKSTNYRITLNLNILLPKS